jgi:hypothetical protein
MIVTTVYDHHLPSTGHIVQLFGSFHFKSTPEKDSKKQKVTITVALISKIIPNTLGIHHRIKPLGGDLAPYITPSNLPITRMLHYIFIDTLLIPKRKLVLSCGIFFNQVPMIQSFCPCAGKIVDDKHVMN